MTRKTDLYPPFVRFPYWLRQSVKDDSATSEIKRLISDLKIRTICQSARCPNIHDCFSNKRCTFLILGEYCTRSCGFCAVESRERLSRPDKKELYAILEAVRALKLRKAVITSVTRDDLDDGGAGHFADCIEILRDAGGHLNIEVLIPDFLGKASSLETVIKAGPDVLAHNIETVPRLYKKVRPGADYNRSLNVIRYAKAVNNDLVTKSGIMLGLGENGKEKSRKSWRN